jgi:hypothetical protein
MTTNTPPTTVKSKLPIILVIGCAVFMLLVAACGVVSAIAIPAFTKYQQRAAGIR